MASKSKRRRRVLGASCILAALIIAGSSFAWFTSKDEVTNRLSANAEYEMAIAEQFQPPENWVPGQVIDKDVGVVNTGTVDAFARVWLTGSMRVLKQSKGNANTNAKFTIDATTKAASYGGTLADVTDQNLLNMNLTKQNATDNSYYKVLDKTQTANPNASASGNQYGYSGNNTNNLFSEVQAMQTGTLAYAPSGAKYSYVLKEETELEIYVKKGADTTEVASATPVWEKVKVPVGTLVIVGETTPLAATITDGVFAANTDNVIITSTSGSTHTYDKVVYVKAKTYDTYGNFLPQNIEAESFTPMTDGLYLFQRNENSSAPTDFEFSGYYMSGFASLATDGAKYTNADFYALNTANSTSTNYKSDYAVKGAVDATDASYDAPIKVTTNGDKIITGVRPTDNLELYNAKYVDLDDTKLKWIYDNNSTIYALYDNDKAMDSKFKDTEDIAVQINLANIGANAQEWTAKGAGPDTTAIKLNDTTTQVIAAGKDASKLTFYYNDDVESGDTTKNLVESVKLMDVVTNKAYLAFDFDLNVNMESIQVTMDENGNEEATAVASWAATGTTPVNTGANGVQAPTPANGEITKITWNDFT